MNRVRIMLVMMFAALTLLACDTGTFVSMLNRATPTPTRTPRPTFTPRAVATPTPEDTPTPEPTATSAASPTATRRATTAPVVKPPTAKPVVVAPPPAPTFAWKQRADQSMQGRCDAGPGVYEVKGRIHDGTDYVAGINVMVLDKDNKIVAQKTSVSRQEMNLEWGVNCREEKNLFNYQLDISAGRATGPLVLRLTRAPNDQTPISPDIRIDIDANGGRWYYDWSK